MTRSSLAGDPRAKHVRLDQEPGLRLPPEDDPRSRPSGRRAGSSSCAIGPCSRPPATRTQAPCAPSRQAIEWLERRGTRPEPFLLWLDLFSPHGPWDPPQPFREQYVTVEPDEFETGDEGELVEEPADSADDDIDIEDVAALIDVPAGAVGDVLSEAELFRAAADLRRDRDAMSTTVWASSSARWAAWAGWMTPTSSSPAIRASRSASTASCGDSGRGSTKS